MGSTLGSDRLSTHSFASLPGLAMYFGYGIWHSLEEQEQEQEQQQEQQQEQEQEQEPQPPPVAPRPPPVAPRRLPQETQC